MQSLLYTVTVTVRPSVCLSHGWISQTVDLGLCIFRRTVAPSFVVDLIHCRFLRYRPSYIYALLSRAYLCVS